MSDADRFVRLGLGATRPKPGLEALGFCMRIAERSDLGSFADRRLACVYSRNVSAADLRKKRLAERLMRASH